MGVANLTTTYFQAAGIFRRETYLLAGGVIVCGVIDIVGLVVEGIVGLAISVGVGAAIVAAALIRRDRAHLAGQSQATGGPGLR